MADIGLSSLFLYTGCTHLMPLIIHLPIEENVQIQSLRSHSPRVMKKKTGTYIDKAIHHDCMKCPICGDTSSGQTQASRPSVIALFSISDLLSSCSGSINVIRKITQSKTYTAYTQVCAWLHMASKKQTITSAWWRMGTKLEMTVITTGEISWRTWN